MHEPEKQGATREVSADETNRQAKVRGTRQCPRYKEVTKGPDHLVRAFVVVREVRPRPEFG